RMVRAAAISSSSIPAFPFVFPSSLRGASATKQSSDLDTLDCFASLAMTTGRVDRPSSRLPFSRAMATSAPNFPTFLPMGTGRMARQFVYHMQGLTKTYPGNRKVLENIHLSFYPDAKIGVLGVNGSGKSTLLRIMAGIDKDYVGEGWVAEGARVGYLEQE